MVEFLQACAAAIWEIICIVVGIYVLMFVLSPIISPILNRYTKWNCLICFDSKVRDKDDAK